MKARVSPPHNPVLMLNLTVHTDFTIIHPIMFSITHPFRIKVLGAGIQKYACNLNMIVIHCPAQGCLVPLFWRAFRYEGELRIVVALTSACRYNHGMMSENAVIDSHDSSQTHISRYIM